MSSLGVGFICEDQLKYSLFWLWGSHSSFLTHWVIFIFGQWQDRDIRSSCILSGHSPAFFFCHNLMLMRSHCCFLSGISYQPWSTAHCKMSKIHGLCPFDNITVLRRFLKILHLKYFMALLHRTAIFIKHSVDGTTHELLKVKKNENTSSRQLKQISSIGFLVSRLCCIAEPC